MREISLVGHRQQYNPDNGFNPKKTFGGCRYITMPPGNVRSQARGTYFFGKVEGNWQQVDKWLLRAICFGGGRGLAKVRTSVYHERSAFTQLSSKYLFVTYFLISKVSTLLLFGASTTCGDTMGLECPYRHSVLSASKLPFLLYKCCAAK